MDWLILISNVIFALIAASLGILGLRTFRAIRHLGTGKSFWIPVCISGAFFLIGSIVAIFHEVNLSLTTRTDEVVQVSRLLALCFLLGGIYSYSRKVNKNLAENLAEKFTIPQKDPPENLEMAVPAARAQSPIQERIIRENPKTETIPKCNHQFGYLRTLPRNASIPDECFSCNRIVKCKHSLVNTLESRELSSLTPVQSGDQPTPQKNRARS